MKKGIRKFLAGTAAIATLTGGMALSVLATPTNVTNVTKMDASYYRTLNAKDGGKLAGEPSLTLKKYKYNSKEQEPIKGVEFRYAKVGDLYQIVNGNEISMAFGIDSEFAGKFRIQNAADYHSSENGEEIYYYKDINAVNAQYLQKINVQTEPADLTNYINGTSFTSISTGQDGTASITNVPYGLYAVIEWSSANAKINGKSVSLTNIQSPFLVALPTSETEDGKTYWEEKVTAKVKNSSDEPTVEKKIVTGNKETLTGEEETLTDGNETVDDTDTTSIGDTVHFRLKGTVPNIQNVTNGNKETFKKYVLVDNLSKGLTPLTEEGGVQLKDVTVRTTAANEAYALGAKDYTISITDYDSASRAGAEYEGGKTITVTFTASGLEKISSWAADDEETGSKEIYFYYAAVVNEHAVVGPNSLNSAPAGNPNEVKLQYKIGTSTEMDTDWDKVTEYTFGINAEKRLAGNAQAVTRENKNAITFVLYSTGDNKAETTDRIYYEMTEDGDGAYRVTANTVASAADNTKMHPATGGALNIRGLEKGTYFLEELTTVPGYNLLKAPVKIEITANKDNNSYVGTDNQYVGTIDQVINQEENTDGNFKVAINNIRGFELPSTGGNGIWIFVLAGVLVVAAGCGYYSLTLRKNRTR